jgi:PAS domain S-box-containing protein
MGPGRRTTELSRRESEILRLAASGLTDKMIAEALAIRTGTINDYWTRIRLKLGAASRTEAVAVHAARETAQLQKQHNALLGELEEQRRVEEQLRVSEEATRVPLETAQSGILVAENGRIVFVNQQLLRLADCRPEDLLGQEATTVMQSYMPGDSARANYVKAVESGRDFKFEFESQTKDGRDLSFLVTVARFESPGGVPARISVFTDVTELKSTQRRLEAALAEAEQEIARLRDHRARV